MGGNVQKVKPTEDKNESVCFSIHYPTNTVLWR